VVQPNGDWLSDSRARGSTFSDVSRAEQASFPTNAPIVLLHLRRAVIKESPGSWSSTSPVGDADSIVLWIESESDADAPQDPRRQTP
jgi:hypothetical protein